MSDGGGAGSGVEVLPKIASITVRHGAGFNMLTVAQYEAMAMDKRTQLIVSGALQFFDEEGNLVSPLVALKSLKQMRQRKG